MGDVGVGHVQALELDPDFAILAIAGAADFQRVGLEVHPACTTTTGGGVQQVTRPGRQAGFVGCTVGARQQCQHAFEESFSTVGLRGNQSNLRIGHREVAGEDGIGNIPFVQHVCQKELLFQVIVITLGFLLAGARHHRNRHTQYDYSSGRGGDDDLLLVHRFHSGGALLNLGRCLLPGSHILLGHFRGPAEVDTGVRELLGQYHTERHPVCAVILLAGFRRTR